MKPSQACIQVCCNKGCSQRPCAKFAIALGANDSIKEDHGFKLVLLLCV